MSRPIRGCDSCGQQDDHPRHVRGHRTLPGGETIRHIDCCAAEGCPFCQASEVECGGRRGQELIDYLTAARAAEE